MVRDSRNNELQVGDVVSLEIPSTRVVGDVQKVVHGGIITGTRGGGGRQMTAGEVIVLVAFRLTVDPTQPALPNVLKLHTDRGATAPTPPSIELSN